MTAAMLLMLAGLAPDPASAAGLTWLARLWHQHHASLRHRDAKSPVCTIVFDFSGQDYEIDLSRLSPGIQGRPADSASSGHKVGGPPKKVFPARGR